MNYHNHIVTEIEAACGVTLDAVADNLPNVIMRASFTLVPDHLPPALAGSVARCALGGIPVECEGITKGGYSIWRPID